MQHQQNETLAVTPRPALVDVLAALESSMAALRIVDRGQRLEPRLAGERERDLREARDAVAELIEAATDLLKSQSGPWERGSAYISARGAENMNAAMKKTRAALARVGGAA